MGSMGSSLPKRLTAWLAVLSFLAVIAFVTIPTSKESANAATGSDFNPGYIISDSLFFDGHAMSASDVQGFLNSKVTSCRSGYTCVKDYSEITASIGSNPMCAAYTSSGLESAATIITKVGEACGISQKAILVTLQKEQGLITDTWPTASQYASAMGALCPDTAPCDSAASGFFKQVYTGAYLFKRYTQPPGTGAGTAYTSRFDLSYPVGATTAIQYHPNAACGAKPVTVQNQATHALYVYTPYTPNDAALGNLYGIGDGCSAYGNRNFWRTYTDWFGSTSANSNPLSPIGHIDGVSNGPGSARISGWAFDPETADPISIHVYLGGPYDRGGTWGGAYVANSFNGWVGSTYPAYGNMHGFNIDVNGLTTPTQACLYVLNVGNGTNTILGCPILIPQTGNPIGNFEAVTANGLRAAIQGWVIDPDSASPVTIHVYTGGAYGTGTWAGQYIANADRQDIARAYPSYGSNHGIAVSLPIGIGTTPICLYAMDGQTSGASTFLGCKSVSSPTGSPYGSLDSVGAVPGGAQLSGWAIDPESTSPIDVHAYVNGQWGGSYQASAARPDVGLAFPGYGDNHGYSIRLTSLHPGQNTVCLYMINVGIGTNPLAGCRIITVPGGMPFGSLDSVSTANGNVTLSGWSIDPDVTDPVTLHVYDNGNWAGQFVASNQRDDVGAVYPGYGSNHGFQVSIPTTAGQHRICVYAINVGSGQTNPLLGCGSYQN